jgi:transposase
MPQKGLTMHTIREILRLRFAQSLSARDVARACHVSHSTVLDYLKRATEANLTWPLPDEIDDDGLAERFGVRSERPTNTRPLPDMDYLLHELRRKHVTRQLLWLEYRESTPDGYSYTQFCHYLNEARSRADPTLRQNHKAGEKLFTDFAGDTVPIVDRQTGEITSAYLFVATLGASNHTYARAVADMQEPRWIGLHVRAFEFLGGVPEMVVCDNTRTAVTKADRYEPTLHPLFADMGEHYGTVILPARAVKPRDKAKVESAVLIAERWILAALRNHTFFSVAELNEAIEPLLEEFNDRPLQRLKVSRRSLFEELDQPVLKPLPTFRYTFEQWKTAKVAIDYHISVEKHFYSVPYRLVGEQVEVKLSDTIVEILHKGKRVASHIRSYKEGACTTDPTHRPKSHQAHLEWTPSRMIGWAEVQVGENTGAFVAGILERKPHPESGYRACLGIISLAKKYPKERMEAAALRLITAQAFSYQSLKSVLKAGFDRVPLRTEDPLPLAPVHQNIRGRDYYNGNPASLDYYQESLPLNERN